MITSLAIPLLGLNPEIEKYQFLQDNKMDSNYEYIAESNDIHNNELESFTFCYHNNDNIHLFKDELLSFLKSKNINSSVYSNTLDIFDKIPFSSFQETLLDNLYFTDYGTVIFDWEKSENNIFSLEIGNKSIGYFIEVDGIDIKQVDGSELSEDEKINTIKSFLQDLSNFLQS